MISNPRTYKWSYGFGQNNVTWNNVSNQKLQNSSFKPKLFIMKPWIQAKNSSAYDGIRQVVVVIQNFRPKFYHIDKRSIQTKTQLKAKLSVQKRKEENYDFGNMFIIGKKIISALDRNIILGK